MHLKAFAKVVTKWTSQALVGLGMDGTKLFVFFPFYSFVLARC